MIIYCRKATQVPAGCPKAINSFSFRGNTRLWLVITEALMLCREQIVVEHQEVRVLADLDRTLGSFDAELLKAVVMQSKPSFPQNR